MMLMMGLGRQSTLWCGWCLVLALRVVVVVSFLLLRLGYPLVLLLLTRWFVLSMGGDDEGTLLIV